MLYVLHLYFAVVAPNSNAAIWSTRVRIPQCMQGEEELLKGNVLGLWITAWRCAPPIRWVDICKKKYNNLHQKQF